MNPVQIFRPSTSSAMHFSSAEKLLHDLLSICDNAFGSDIEVKVQNKSFPCHKNILAARSSYFKERLGRGQYLTEIVEVGNADAFELVRRYMYTGIVDQNQADEGLIAHVLTLSVKYKLDELTNFMADQVRSRITTENVVNMFNLVSVVKLHSIADECLELIRTKGDDCLQNECYCDLSFSQIVQLLKQANLSKESQSKVIRNWCKKHPELDATKLFNMLDGEIDGEENQEVRTSEKQYMLINGYDGEIVILNGETFEEVSTRNEPTTKFSQLAVCRGMFSVINTECGEIKSTPVSSMLTSQPIKWDTCANFQSSHWARGRVAVVDTIIYFMDRTHLWKFDTTSKTVSRSDAFGGGFDYFFSLVELEGLFYCFKANILKVTNGINGWRKIRLPELFGQYPNSGSLIKMDKDVCIVSGRKKYGGYANSVLCYNPNHSYWTNGNPINQARNQATAVLLDGGRSLLIGGYNGQWMETIELIDQTNQWSLIDYKVKLEIPLAVTFYA